MAKAAVSLALAPVLSLLAGASAGAAPPEPGPPPPGLQAVSFRHQAFLVRIVDPARDDLRLFLNDGDGKPYGSFDAVARALAARGERLVFAANAGMFEADFRPVGLLVQDGAETAPLNLRDGDGNFYLKPNGVFLINAKRRAMIVESSTYPALLIPAQWATQSGPLLAQRGDVHPDFMEGSRNLTIRDGVGVRRDGRVVFAISRLPVNLYDFALFFVRRENCPDALYLDGHVSSFYAGGRAEPVPAAPLGPIFGLVEKAKGDQAP